MIMFDFDEKYQTRLDTKILTHSMLWGGRVVII